MNCPKCDADISDTHEGADPDTGVMSGGWYCDACDLAIADWEVGDDCPTTEEEVGQTRLSTYE